jgi:hypothetical protein
MMYEEYAGFNIHAIKLYPKKYQTIAQHKGILSKNSKSVMALK